jgi:hypothetical protein
MNIWKKKEVMYEEQWRRIVLCGLFEDWERDEKIILKLIL